MGYLIQIPPGAREVARREREPGDERYALPLAGLYNRLRGAVGQVITVLDADDGHDVYGRHEFPDTHVGEAHMPDLALVAQLGESPDGVLERYATVRPMELVYVDRVHLETAQAPLAGFAQVPRPSVGLPAPGAGTYEAALRSDHQVVRVRVESGGDLALVDLGAVGVGGVYEVDTNFDDPPQHGLRGPRVLRLPPDAWPAQPHGPEPEAPDREVAQLQRTSPVAAVVCHSSSLPLARTLEITAAQSGGAVRASPLCSRRLARHHPEHGKPERHPLELGERRIFSHRHMSPCTGGPPQVILEYRRAVLRGYLLQPHVFAATVAEGYPAIRRLHVAHPVYVLPEHGNEIALTINDHHDER